MIKPFFSTITPRKSNIHRRIRKRISVSGTVQGIGFRPFVYRLAHQHNLGGFVLNDSHGVRLEIEGDSIDVDTFIFELETNPPPLANITGITSQILPTRGDILFCIEESLSHTERRALVPPDIGICQDCLTELFDPTDRRYLYPFISCTNCGPRYTIIQDIPYDRSYTTMSEFPLCPQCQKEYEDQNDRRFHAQTNACWDCGPQLQLLDKNIELLKSNDPVKSVIHLITDGNIVAVKGLGGFHLAVDATNEIAVEKLRERKQRETKPFALMSYDLSQVEEYCHVSHKEAELLKSPQRPIVLLKKRKGNRISNQIAPTNNYFGVMLPYTPLHYLLLRYGYSNNGRHHDGTSSPIALVMTSGNLSDEPMATNNYEAIENLSKIADYFLSHNRKIHVRSDDSIARLQGDTPIILRRSRGYTPTPVKLKYNGKQILAVGGELKNTICLVKEDNAFVSQHIGDLRDIETRNFFEDTIAHLKKIFDIEPEIIAHDLHPDYFSTRYVLDSEYQIRNRTNIRTVGVQHHHAHIASCLAEHGLSEDVIGVAFDGTGYGLDGTIWGGEFMIANLNSFNRCGHLQCIPLPGGDKAINEPWRSALSYLYAAFGKRWSSLPIDFVCNIDRKAASILISMINSGFNSPLTSSAGRLFDAVSSLIMLCDEATYEGEAAIRLESMIDPITPPSEAIAYNLSIRDLDEGLVLQTVDLIKAIVEDIKSGLSKAVISTKFHNAIAEATTNVCVRMRDKYSINKVVLSGGVFQNFYLSEKIRLLLRQNGFDIVQNELVPPNDGGISLGQAAVAQATAELESVKKIST